MPCQHPSASEYRRRLEISTSRMPNAVVSLSIVSLSPAFSCKLGTTISPYARVLLACPYIRNGTIHHLRTTSLSVCGPSMERRDAATDLIVFAFYHVPITHVAADTIPFFVGINVFTSRFFLDLRDRLLRFSTRSICHASQWPSPRCRFADSDAHCSASFRIVNDRPRCRAFASSARRRTGWC